MALGKGEHLVGMIVFDNGGRSVLAISERGYGKRSLLDDYRLQSRGGKGIITIKTTPRTGRLVSIKGVQETDDVMIVTQNGIMIRMNVSSIRMLGRNTQGVRLISLKEGDAIADVTRVVIDEETGPPSVSPLDATNGQDEPEDLESGISGDGAA
jgi:DNA gyrase subunit A